jgi:hypothetical protein
MSEVTTVRTAPSERVCGWLAPGLDSALNLSGTGAPMRASYQGVDPVERRSVAGYGKMSPGVFDVAAVKRVWISGQLTTFQNALT